jgi:hypothetical protein
VAIATNLVTAWAPSCYGWCVAYNRRQLGPQGREVLLAHPYTLTGHQTLSQAQLFTQQCSWTALPIPPPPDVVCLFGLSSNGCVWSMPEQDRATPSCLSLTYLYVAMQTSPSSLCRTMIHVSRAPNPAWACSGYAAPLFNHTASSARHHQVSRIQYSREGKQLAIAGRHTRVHSMHCIQL